jgi:uncharacterized protein (TIGR00369 family)
VTADTTSDPQARIREQVVAVFARAIPHNQALGAEIVDLGEGWAEARLPFREDFLGDPEAGLWQTSVGISLIDATCGLSVFLHLPEYTSIATLDLRMEYLRPAVADEPLFAYANCHHLTRSVAFVHGRLHQGEREKPTALGTATFMRNDSASKRRKR